jgi:Tripartite tricarboxylate transporter family receptor
LDAPEMVKAMADQGGEPGRVSPHGFSDFIQSERSRWKKLAAESGVPTVAGPL